ncbi:MAG TPA: ABC transporter ATP-binding protein [Bacillota bacterium]|nr:ABC transporter ATP-binding protein [Bacillota bacterium]
MSSCLVLEMKAISKSFAGVQANQNINLEIRRGEVHALLGENGAGKTTLMKILYGLYKPDSGEIFLNGQKTAITSPNQAIRNGIGMVHQHFMLIPPFSVLENIILGCEPQKTLGRLNHAAALEKITQLSDELGLKVNPTAKVEDISVGLQQRVEILKALYRDAEILILDEPTAVLTPQEADELGQILRMLVNQGKSVIFITHKLKEVKKFADRITVIRRGQVVATVDCATATVESLAEMMVGRKVALSVEKPPAQPKEIILEAEDICALDNRKLPALKNISFTAKAGEILAIAGVDGNGQSELIEVLTGLRNATQGRLRLENQDILNKNPRQIINAGISHIPEDRQKRGLILDFTLWENLVLEVYRTEAFSRYGVLKEKACHSHAAALIAEYDVRTPHANLKASDLSGGNQQKLVVAREINRNPKLMVVAQPTRGLDVGAIEFVHQQLIAQRDQGKAIVLFSLELDEIMALADRIAVLYEGEIVGCLAREDATEENLGLMMTGSLRLNGKEAIPAC